MPFVKKESTRRSLPSNSCSSCSTKQPNPHGHMARRILSHNDFFSSFIDELTQHLEHHTRRRFFVQRNQLFFREEVVYKPERDATGESFAFKMYSDGIRELTFHQGLIPTDLSFFLDALWGTSVRDSGSEEERARRRRRYRHSLVGKESFHHHPGYRRRIVRSSGFGRDDTRIADSGLHEYSLRPHCASSWTASAR